MGNEHGTCSYPASRISSRMGDQRGSGAKYAFCNRIQSDHAGNKVSCYEWLSKAVILLFLTTIYFSVSVSYVTALGKSPY